MGIATRPYEKAGRLSGNARVRIPWVSTMKQMLAEDYIAYKAGNAGATPVPQLITRRCLIDQDT